MAPPHFAEAERDMKLALSLIRRDGGTQSRAELNAEAVTAYGDAMLAGAVFPPVIVFYDGAEYWLADGFHRWEAADAAGLEEIESDVRQGTRRDAILFSVRANASHGVQRTHSDKRRAVQILLNDAEWSLWSHRKIAEATGVSHTFVSKLVGTNPLRSGNVATVGTESVDGGGNNRHSLPIRPATVATSSTSTMASVATPSAPPHVEDTQVAARAEESLVRAVVVVVDACTRRRARLLLQPVLEDSIKKLARLAQESAA